MISLFSFFTVVICVTSSATTEPSVDECSRFSPEEFYHSVIKPEINSKIEELDIFFSVVIERLLDNVQTLIPRQKLDQGRAGDMTAGFHKLGHFLSERLKRLSDDLEAAWEHVFQTNRAFLEEDGGGVEDLLWGLKKVGEAHDIANNTMAMLGRELAITIQTLTTHVIDGLRLAMEKIPHPDQMTQDQATQRAHKLIEQVAPNLLGKVLGKVLDRGLTGGDLATERPAYIRNINSRVHQLIRSFSKLEHRALPEEGATREEVQELWADQVGASLSRGGARHPSTEEIGIKYSDEEQVTDTLLNILIGD